MILPLERKKVRRIFFLFLIIGVLFYFLWLVFSQWPDNKLHLIFCDVGQGDAILAIQGNYQVLIDGGLIEEKDKLLYCLESHLPFWDRKIEVLINTHPDEDHFGGFLEVLKRYRVGWFFHSGFDNSQSWQFKELKNFLFDQRVCSKKLVAGDVFRSKDIYFEVLWPNLENQDAQEKIQEKFFDENKTCPQPVFDFQTDNLNNISVVSHLRFGEVDVLLTGDIEKETEQILAWRKLLPQVEILKIAHHGSRSSTTEEILEATDPELAVISCGENSFGHPNEEVLERLEEREIECLRTDLQGSIEIVVDKNNYVVK